jgi:hypothetical protein
MSTGLSRARRFQAIVALHPVAALKVSAAQSNLQILTSQLLWLKTRIRAWRRAPTSVGEFASDHLSWLFNWAVQPVTNVRGEEAFGGKDLIRKRPSGDTAY